MLNDVNIKRKLDLLKKSVSFVKKTNNKSIKYIFKNFKLLSGKNIRGLLVLTTTEALSGKINMSAINAAVAIELLHQATLIHDDIIDNSYKRRGDPTLNKKIGYELSVLTGDYLFSYVNRLVVNQKLPILLKIFSETVKDICEGAIDEVYNKNNTSMSEKQYFDIINKKTASLIKMSVLCGSIISGNNFNGCLSDYGRYVGIAFQIKDDILDMSSTSKRLGKPAGSDIKEGKITLPFIFALKNADKKEKKEMIELFNKRKIKPLIKLIKKNNGIDDAFAIAQDYVKKAKERLNKVNFKHLKNKTQLEKIADYAINRDY
ncbi:MAG: polyprenyl synthetase family protein [Candidatus Goldbacteria bacterium]|nr:polyprenyl synthetase family protein [Candidatus Goldiibacteriota bacterium]